MLLFYGSTVTCSPICRDTMTSFSDANERRMNGGKNLAGKAKWRRSASARRKHSGACESGKLNFGMAGGSAPILGRHQTEASDPEQFESSDGSVLSDWSCDRRRSGITVLELGTISGSAYGSSPQRPVHIVVNTPCRHVSGQSLLPGIAPSNEQ